MTKTLALIAVLACAGLFNDRLSAQISQQKPARILIPVPDSVLHYRPLITLQKALKLAEDYIDSTEIDIASYFLIQVEMIHLGPEHNPGEPHWHFLWMNEVGTPGDVISIIVTMKGEVRRQGSL